MNIKYAKLMKKLWELTGEVGAKGETNERYAEVYAKLSEALDVAESVGLIVYKETED